MNIIIYIVKIKYLFTEKLKSTIEGFKIFIINYFGSVSVVVNINPGFYYL